MPQTYRVKLSDGREFEVATEGGPPSEQDVLSSLGIAVPQSEPAQSKKSLWQQPGDVVIRQAVVEAAKGAWNQANPVKIAAGLYEAAKDPVRAAQKMIFPTELGMQAVEAAKRGDYITAARKGIDYALPVIGPAIDPIADRLMTGEESIPKALGESATLGAMTFAPFAPRGAVMKPPRIRPNPNAVEVSAAQFAEQRGIPLDLGTKTGSQIVKNLQKKTANTWGGASTAEKMQAAQAEQLSRVGSELAAEARPGAATAPVEAAQSVRDVLTKRIEGLHQTASTAYDKIRAIEQAKPSRPPTSEGLTALDVSQRTPLAVDITAAVKQLQPLYTQLKRESELGIPMHGAKGRTLAALDGLMNAPNWAPLSVVDGALSDLKALARGADMPELRTSGQATAAQAVQALDAQVRSTAAKAGPHVLKALEEGRAATRQKYATAEVLDLLSGEPGQVFRQLTQGKDVGLERLRQVQKLAPKETANIARAYLEDMVARATKEGGFAHADALYADWNRLGPETKRILFPKQGQIAALDNYFLIAKKIKENPNPSGTAQTLNATNLTFGGIPAWALSKMLYTPAGVRYLTAARVATKSPSRSVQAFAVSQLAKAAQASGVPLETIPALATETDRREGSRKP